MKITIEALHQTYSEIIVAIVEIESSWYSHINNYPNNFNDFNIAGDRKSHFFDSSWCLNETFVAITR